MIISKRMLAIRVAVLLLAALLFCGLSSSGSAAAYETASMGGGMQPPPIRSIATAAELRAWCEETASGTQDAFARLTANILVDFDLTFPQTSAFVTLNMVSYSLRIARDATVTLDNPKLGFYGVDQLISVRMGGTLNLYQGELKTDQPNSIAVLLNKGAHLNRLDSFNVGNIVDLASGDGSTTLPPPSLPSAEIVHVWEPDVARTTVGKPASLPRTVEANVKESGDVRTESIEVLWEDSAPIYQVAGVYEIVGALSPDSLSKLGLQNSQGLKARLQVEVIEENPPLLLEGYIVSEGKHGAALEFWLPYLPEDTTALYLFQQDANGSWVKKVFSAQIPEYNFLEYVHRQPLNTYIVYRMPGGIQSSRFRVEVVGSVYEGISNEVMLTSATYVPPGESSSRPESSPDWDDGNQGGNRGGVGQGETDRELPESSSENNGSPAYGIPVELDEEPSPLPAGEAASAVSSMEETIEQHTPVQNGWASSEVAESEESAIGGISVSSENPSLEEVSSTQRPNAACSSKVQAVGAAALQEIVNQSTGAAGFPLGAGVAAAGSIVCIAGAALLLRKRHK